MDLDLLYKLLKTPSVSGDEHLAIDIFDCQMASFCNIRHDALGNAYALLNSSSHMKYLLEAHIDEIGFQVTYIEDNGAVYIRPCGCVDIIASLSSMVLINTRNGEQISGVIGKNPPHFERGDSSFCHPQVGDVWIDTGLEPSEVKHKICVGDSVSYFPHIQQLGKYRLSARGLDDKVGVYIIAEVMSRLSKLKLPFGVASMAAVQEEIGFRGSNVGPANIPVDEIICVDTGFATDTVDMKKSICGDISLGKGVIINRHADCTPTMVNKAIDIAESFHIPYQISTFHSATGGTDASRLQIVGQGRPSLLLGIPCRYMHTTVEMCDKRDIQAIINLIVEYIIH